MNGFFAENIGLFSENCYPYVGKNAKCHYQQDFPKSLTNKCDGNIELARVNRTYQVEPTETSMQKEILKNGMIDVTWSFPIQA